jgi:hypothetical protein
LIHPAERFLKREPDDPSGKPLMQVRPIGDSIEHHVRALMRELGVDPQVSRFAGCGPVSLTGFDPRAP